MNCVVSGSEYSNAISGRSYSMHKHLWLSLISAALLAACGGGGSEEERQAEFGRISLGVTDAPVDDAEHVVVEFTGVEIKAANDSRPEVFDFTTPRSIDLLALEGGGSEILLRDETLPAGDYEWIRLKVNAGRTGSDSYVDLEDGSRHALFIPSGEESGLKLIGGFTVRADTPAAFTIDFDLRRSVIRPPGQSGDFVLKPVLRIVNNQQAGTVAGAVAEDLIPASCTPAVYAFTGADATPDDLGGVTEPFVTARVLRNETSGAYEYRIGFLPAGAYTLAFTCEAIYDELATDETIQFPETQNATVGAGQTTTANFE